MQEITTQEHDLFICVHGIIIHKHEILIHAHEIINRSHDIIIHAYEIIIGALDLIICANGIRMHGLDNNPFSRYNYLRTQFNNLCVLFQ